MNNQQQTKKPFDHEAFRQDLANLRAHLEHRTWTFACNTFYDFHILQEEEKDLFDWAKKLGQQGVRAYIDAQRAAMDSITNAQMNDELDRSERTWRDAVKGLREQIEEVKAKYMPAVDRFQEDLDRFDWHYAASDSLSVYKAGEATLKKLVTRAEEGGKEFQDAMVQTWNRQFATNRTWDSIRYMK